MYKLLKTSPTTHENQHDARIENNSRAKPCPRCRGVIMIIVISEKPKNTHARSTTSPGTETRNKKHGIKNKIKWTDIFGLFVCFLIFDSRENGVLSVLYFWLLTLDFGWHLAVETMGMVRGSVGFGFCRM